MIRPLDSFFRDKHGVYSLPCSQPAFSYSDGQATEHIILNVLTKTGDLSVFSEDLIKRISDWATEYHFCSERHNLLRHVQLHSGMRILELGKFYPPERGGIETLLRLWCEGFVAADFLVFNRLHITRYLLPSQTGRAERGIADYLYLG